MESGGDVKIVLIAKIDQCERRIVLQKWEPRSNEGQVATHLTQNITISKRAAGSEEDIGQVKEGSLVVEFEKLFLQPADQASETDLVIFNDVLMDKAEQV